MIILTIIYSLIILYIIGRGLYISRKPLGNIQNRESFQDSISLSALPFYINQEKINLFAFAINFILISFFSLSLVPDLISNHTVFCQDNNNENESYLYSGNKPFHKDTNIYKYKNCKFEWGQYYEQNIYEKNEYKGILAETINSYYKISNKDSPFIFNLNYKNINIDEPLKVMEGLSEDFVREFSGQEALLKNLNSQKKSGYEIGEVRNMYKSINEKSLNLLYLTSNACNKILLRLNLSTPYLKNNVINDEIMKFIKSPEKKDFEEMLFEKFYKNADQLFSILEKIVKISKENINALKEKDCFLKIDKNNIKNIGLKKIIFKENSNINKNPYELYCECNNKLIVLSRNLSIYSVLKNINSFHVDFQNPYYFKTNKEISSLESIKDMGFWPSDLPYDREIMWGYIKNKTAGEK